MGRNPFFPRGGREKREQSDPPGDPSPEPPPGSALRLRGPPPALTCVWRGMRLRRRPEGPERPPGSRGKESGGHTPSPHGPPRGPQGDNRRAPRAAAGRVVTLRAPLAPRPTRRTRPGMSRSPSGGCSCGGGGAEGRGHRPATRSPGSSCGGRRGSGRARLGGYWLDRGAPGSHQMMERMTGRATRSTRTGSSRAWSRALVSERFVTVLSQVASKRSGGRFWISEAPGAKSVGRDVEGGCG